MSGFYEEMQGIATELLTEFDQGGLSYIALTPVEGGTADDRPDPIETPYALKAVARGVAFQFINGSDIVATDLQTTFAVDSRFEPDMKGFIVKDGQRHKVVRVVKMPATGVPAAFTVIFRK